MRADRRQSDSTVRRSSSVSAVTGDVPGVEQAEDGAQVLGSGAARFGESPYRVVQSHAGVPHRVPNAIGHFCDIAIATPRVQQKHVEIAAGRQLLASVSADRDEGNSVFVAEEGLEPRVGQSGQCCTPARPGESGSGQQRCAALGVRSRSGDHLG